MSRFLVRPSTAADVPAVSAIYGWHVRHGSGTFEADPPDEGEMGRRRDDVLAKGLPWLVLERESQVIGFASANQFRPRPGYRYCLEDSVYLAEGLGGRGLGRLLLTELIARCEGTGARQMLAVIGGAAPAGSIGLHRALGFEHVGTTRAVGWKFDRWLDVVFMQRSLGFGASTPP